MNHRSFPLDLCNSRSNDVALPSSVDVSELWRKRLGHFNFSSLVKMCKLNLVHNMHVIYYDGVVCEVCEKGKQKRLPFSAQSWRASKKLQLVHTDICGPIGISSLNGS